jgi:nicotinamide phosphoribosyltransferase
LSWQLPTAATIGAKFKSNAVEWVKKTDEENLWLADFMCHDFHSRGGNPFTSIAVGLGHAMSNSGSDTLNIIPASRYYYDFPENEVPIYSVNASEHSVSCTGIFYYENLLKIGSLNESIKEYYSSDAPCEGSIENPDYLAIAEWLNLRSWLLKFPKGVLSVVSDTFNLWKLITFILPRLKKEILARDGKLVIRPDSGNPVDITCGLNIPVFKNIGDVEKYFYKNVNGNIKFILNGKWYKAIIHSGNDFKYEEYEFTPEDKGVIELLYDIFGGTINKQGYKVLDSHIGSIYGDSLNLERQVNIYSRLADKKFAATNIFIGCGSYVYVMLSRDSAGYAAKGSWFEVEDENGTKCYNIYKDPITDDGTKKSLKGFCQAIHDDNMEIICLTECSVEQESQGLLQVIYADGNFHNQTTLTEIRERLQATL